MSDIILLPALAEPEETLESGLASILAETCSVPVETTIAPSVAGGVQRMSSDTFVRVAVDLASQDLDIAEPATFITMSASVVVTYALADDPSGLAFRNECRKVRAALLSLTGDGCDVLTTDSVVVDGFVLDSTSTTFEAGDNPVNVKNYTATAKCRHLTTTGEEPNNG